MTTEPDNTPRNPFYYILLALGCAGLLGWFYLLRHWQLMEWMAQLGPETHKGSMNLLAVMLWLVPALVVWKYYLRWLNQRFDIRGQFDQDRHDAQYQTTAQDPPTGPQPSTESTAEAAKPSETAVVAKQEKKH